MGHLARHVHCTEYTPDIKWHPSAWFYCAILCPNHTCVAMAVNSSPVAEITLFSIIHLVQFTTRVVQEWRFWHHKKRRSIGRCLFYSWFGMIGLWAQCKQQHRKIKITLRTRLLILVHYIPVRIAGSAMVLVTSHPSKSMLITEYVLGSIGLAPLLFEVSLALLLRYVHSDS